MTADRLRALLAEATPGPWCTDEVNEDQICVFGTIFAAESWSEDAPWLYNPRDATAADSRLVVAAVNALPALLAVADAAQAWLDYWTEQSDGLLMDDTEKALALKARVALAALGKEPTP